MGSTGGSVGRGVGALGPSSAVREISRPGAQTSAVQDLSSTVGVVVWLCEKGQVSGATRGLSDVSGVDGPQTDTVGGASRAPSGSIVRNANHFAGLTDTDVVIGEGLHVFTRVLGSTCCLAERQGDQTKED